MKKKITTDNPQGVEYPAAVTADGKLVRAIDLEKEESKETLFFFPGCEGDIEEKLQFVLRGKTKFFRHYPGYCGDRNEPDRYLHNYAELRLKQRFDESEATGQFIVQYHVVEKCPDYDECKLRLKSKCLGGPRLSLKSLNLRDYYDTCTIEKKENKYIADLLLESSKDPSVKPMFLEVYVTHKCTEEKVSSGYRVIEIKVEDKKDAEKEIIENAGELVDEYKFMKLEYEDGTPSPIVFYGFDRSSPFSDYKPYVGFMLRKSESGLIADKGRIPCNKIKEITEQDCVFRLFVPGDELKNTDDFYEFGMAKAYNMGLPVQDCTLCSSYKIPHKRSSAISSLSCRVPGVFHNNGDVIPQTYIFQLPYRIKGFDKSQKAAACPNYRLDSNRISKLVNSLETKSIWP